MSRIQPCTTMHYFVRHGSLIKLNLKNVTKFTIQRWEASLIKRGTDMASKELNQKILKVSGKSGHQLNEHVLNILFILPYIC